MRRLAQQPRQERVLQLREPGVAAGKVAVAHGQERVNAVMAHAFLGVIQRVEAELHPLCKHLTVKHGLWGERLASSHHREAGLCHAINGHGARLAHKRPAEPLRVFCFVQPCEQAMHTSNGVLRQLPAEQRVTTGQRRLPILSSITTIVTVIVGAALCNAEQSGTDTVDGALPAAASGSGLWFVGRKPSTQKLL